jgi:hypothetical protein
VLVGLRCRVCLENDVKVGFCASGRMRRIEVTQKFCGCGKNEGTEWA